MRSVLLLLSSFIVAFSFVPYIIQTIRRQVRPRIASWLTWSLITLIALPASLSQHAYASAAVTGASTLTDLTVLGFALHHGNRDYGWLDAACQLISLTGLVLWQLLNDPIWAISCSIVADLFAAVPTYFHAWIAPHEEGWLSFMLFGGGSLLAACTLTRFDFVNSAFPIYLTANGLSIAFVIAYRQRQTRKPI